MKHPSLLLAAAAWAAVSIPSGAAERWTAGQAQAWGKDHGWLSGANFGPSTAINQLEMWQKDSFDPAAIDRELGWAESLGFTSMRVFLHHMAWKQDPAGYLERLDRYLALAAKHRIGTMFVLFDSCWDPFPKPGPQRAPRPHVHNSGWMQDPGVEILKDPAKFDALEPYVTAVVSRFRDDPRVQVWDVWNEPDNRNGSSYGAHEPENKADIVRPRLGKTFAWARAAKPTQPLTSGVWIGTWGDPAKLSPMEQLQLEQSDVISFHCYGKPDQMRECIRNLRRYGRPILCTEYMARPQGSTFDPILGILKDEGVAAYNWGFVAGKTQTIYPWDSWKQASTNEPPVWFHDIFRPDGTAYRPAEAAYIRSVTGVPARKRPE